MQNLLMAVTECLQTLKSTQAMGEAMKGVTKAMRQMNRQMNLPALQKIMREFEIQNEKMEIVSSTMNDAIDDALEGDEEEEETEELVNQVLDEIGIDVNSEVSIMLVCHSSLESTIGYTNLAVVWMGFLIHNVTLTTLCSKHSLLGLLQPLLLHRLEQERLPLKLKPLEVGTVG